MNPSSSSLYRSAHASRLIRFLDALAVAEVSDTQQPFAERLGQLFDFSAAVSLAAAYDRLPVRPADAPEHTPQSLESEVLQARSKLVAAIARSFGPDASPRLRLPVLKPETLATPSQAFEPFLRFYLFHQRDMDTLLRQLRADLRQHMAGETRELRQLAAVDSAFDDILQERARKLFARVPLLLEKRFVYLYEAHRQALADAADDPARWCDHGGWLDRFHKDMQGCLLAELDVRMQPILGLLEALGSPPAG